MNCRHCTTITLIILCLLALVLRVGAVVTLKSWHNPDAMEHKTIALQLVKGNGFAFNSFGRFEPSSIQSPPYPLLLAGCFKVFGPATPAAYFAAMMVNCVAGALVVALTFLLVRAIGGAQAVALLAAALVAIWPTQIYACTKPQAVVLITAAITAVMAFFYISIRSGKLLPWTVFSICGTLAALTEPAFLPVMILSGLIILFCWNLRFSVRIRNAAVLLLAAVVIIGPWSLRNRKVHGVWVPVKNTFWVNAWKGNNDHATGSDRIEMTSAQKQSLLRHMFSLHKGPRFDQGHQYATLTLAEQKQLKEMTEQQRELFFKNLTVSWIRSHPGSFAELSMLRLRKTIWIDWDNPESYNGIYVLSKAALILTGGIGLLLALRRRWSLAFPALIYLSTLLLYTLTITAARFAIPFEPLMLGFSALTLVTTWSAITGRREVREEPSVGYAALTARGDL